MTFKPIILGITVTAVLLAVLVATRLMVLPSVEQEFVIREIETVSMPEPPAPQEEPLPAENIPPPPPPPPPALTDLRPSVDMTQPVMLVNIKHVDPRLNIDTFFSDQPPAPLPDKIKIVRPQVSEAVMQTKPQPRVALTPPLAKSEFSLGELDQQPKLLRNPSVIFPRSIKDANSGNVVVRVSILASGRSQFISVVSSTHDDLVPLAKRIANGSRFTPPTRQGKAVKAIMTWPITIKK